MFVVDTNILVYAANLDSPFHASSRSFVDGCRRRMGAWYLTWGICYEFLRVTTRPRVLRYPWTGPQAWEFLDAILASPGVGFLVPGERHRQVLAEVMRELPHLAGNILYDAKTAVLMREHGIRSIYTRDTDFHRFPFLEPVDPTR